MSSSLARLINLSFATGTFPDPLKLAIITPLLKKSNLDPENLANFRPVSGLPFMSKLIEKAVLKRLSTHLQSSHLIVPFQSAYRSNHSTETALLRVFNDLVMTVDSRRAAVLTLLDLSAAFDTVDHPTLLSRLEAWFGVSGTVLLWFCSYIANRSQVVSISGVTSSPAPLCFGVPQGSVLGPTLFVLYNSPLHSIIRQHGLSAHYFADDTQIYTEFEISKDGRTRSRLIAVLNAAQKTQKHGCSRTS
jgi:hypothetical protein